MYFFILLLPIGLVLTFIASNNRGLIEDFYSQGIFLFINKFLFFISNIFKFSLGEILFYIFIALILILIIKFIYNLIHHHNRKKVFTMGIINIAVVLSIIYFLFIVLWGLNYHRLPLSNNINLEVKPVSIEILHSLCEDLIGKTNYLRENVDEDEFGVAYIDDNFENIAERSQLGFNELKKKYNFFDLKISKPKGVIFSKALSYAGIAGVYSPFTGEANINTMVPQPMLPNTTTHEIAHQLGFAREDEANYIAYLACIHHPDKDFQYSGMLLALIHSMNTLYRQDINSYNQLIDDYSNGVRRDLTAINNFWNSYKGPIEKTSQKINNTYLKSNLQKDGTKSYGRMVDLLIAEYKEKLINSIN